MRVLFFEAAGDERHIVTVEDMEVPGVGDTVWIRTSGPDAKNNVPEGWSGHEQARVVRRDFSLHVIGAECEPHAEVFLLKVRPGDAGGEGHE
jgi:hypothetical protein